MSTDIRPEVSKKKDYWIPKHRYYELKHFVMQYPEWMEYLANTNGLVKGTRTDEDKVQLGAVSDPTWLAVERRAHYIWAMRLVEHTAELTDPKYGKIIMDHLIKEDGYNNVKDSIKLSRSEYYRLYRKFFWILDQNQFLYKEV